jgi:hypothetical protein
MGHDCRFDIGLVDTGKPALGAAEIGPGKYNASAYDTDARRELPPCNQQEGTKEIGSGEKPKSENAKRRRPRHQNINQYQSTEKIAGLHSPFLLIRLVHFHAAIWHNL